MARKAIPKNDVPASLHKKDAQIQKLKAKQKSFNMEILAEKEKRRLAKRQHKEDVERLRSAGRIAYNEICSQSARLDIAIEEMEKKCEKTKNELIEQQVILKLATDEQVKADIVKEDQETRERLEQRTRSLENAGPDRKPWKECELCSLKFKEDGDRIPKVLKCGHTICWGCVQRLAKPDFVRCPFDKTVFVLTESDNLDKIPKNFRVLNAL